MRIPFLPRIESLIFSDYRLVSRLMTKCEAAVTKTNCGRVTLDDTDPHSQVQRGAVAQLL